MKVAVTCENDQVFQHFGHTPGFAVFTVEGNAVSGKTLLSSGETGHGALAGLLQQNGVNVLICGGIGAGALMALAGANIRVIGGASGSVDAVIAAFAAGNLAVDPDFQCHHHDHEVGHDCGSHGCGSHGCH